MADDHIAVPPGPERSVITRKGKQHQTNCAEWGTNKKPWPANAHHILPVTCFNPIDVKPKDKAAYVKRCVLVSKWDINGGDRFKVSGDPNNMVRLPLYSAYFNAYPLTPTSAFRRAAYPINKCMHNSRYSEHHLYIKEVKQHLQATIWSTLQEDKKKHKGKGKPILGELEGAVKHFRQQLEERGNRQTPSGNKGTLACWHARKTDGKWMLTFSMASDGMTQYPI